MNMTLPEVWAWLLTLPWWQSLPLIWLVWALFFSPSNDTTVNVRLEKDEP